MHFSASTSFTPNYSIQIDQQQHFVDNTCNCMSPMRYSGPPISFGRAPLLSWQLCSIFVFFMLLHAGEGVIAGRKATCLSNQTLALLQFKQSLSVESQQFLSAWWNGSDCCEWNGIACDYTTGFVTSLDIYGVSLQASQLDPSLFKLHHLRHLDLGFNSIGGTIPSSLSKLTKLVHLGLKNCGFVGSIPKSFQLLPKLTLLDLSYNYLIGEVPPGLLNHSTLQYLSLHYNNLNGSLPDFGSGFSSLKVIDISHNQLDGEITSSISNLSHLQVLALEQNNFSGTISLSLFQNMKKLLHLDLSENNLTVELPDIVGLNHQVAIFPNLQQLILSYCNIKGEFPQFLQKAKVLEVLDLSYNNINGKMPTWIWSLPYLQRLYLSHNMLHGFEEAINISSSANLDLNLISPKDEFPSTKPLKRIALMWLDVSNNNVVGAIPPALFCSMLELEVLRLSRNNLMGTIPDCITNLTELNILDLCENQLQGRIPRGLICRVNKLESLILKGNKLTGEIAKLLYNCSSDIIVLDLSKNRLIGTMPDNWTASFDRLKLLDLSSNQLYGPIPDFNIGSTTNLTVLNLNSNKFVGKIPRSLSNCSQLRIINLCENELRDVFPFWLGHLDSLRILVLCSNKLYGTIRPSFSDHVFSSLQILDISGNQLAGSLPLGLFKNFTSMMKGRPKLESIYLLYWRYYQVMETHITEHFTIRRKLPNVIYVEETLPLTIKGHTQEERIMSMLTSIDMSNNLFVGRIPEEIGALEQLYSLNLSWNNLEGLIPKSFGQLQSIESVDLSHNQLSGTIPEELAHDTFLSFLDLSYNNLEGRIPQGNQFGTFNVTSFYGNPRLCGPPLTISCPNSNHGSQDSIKHVEEIALDPHWEYLAAGIGYAVGFWTVILPILFIQKVGSWFCVHVDRAIEAFMSLFYH